MALYEAVYANERKLNANAEYHEAAQELTGVAFSLWRAVFLSDTTGEFEDQTADIKKFLVSLIADNVVLYNTDKNARNWSFRYYLANATYRLDKLSGSRLALVSREELSTPAESEKDEWMRAEDIFDRAVRKFRALLNSGS